MSKKGFTLVELLAVIVILGVVLLIAVPNINRIIYNTRMEVYVKNEEILLNAASTYISKNVSIRPQNEGDTVEVTLQELQNEGLMEVVYNPKTEEECSGYVMVTKVGDIFDYSIHLNCIDSNINDSTDDGLVGYWKLADGKALDYSINSNHGTIYDAVPAADRFGEGEGAFEFIYTSDRIQIGNPSNIRYPNNVTISVWINSNDITKTQNIISRNGPYFLRIHNSKLRFCLYTGTWLFAPGTITLSSNTWYNLILTYDGNYLKGYVNGELDIDSPQTGDMISFSDLFIGYTPVVGEQSPFDGLIDDVRIYNRALTKEEIKLYYDIEKFKNEN